jgi:hypothetical protein
MELFSWLHEDSAWVSGRNEKTKNNGLPSNNDQDYSLITGELGVG